MPSRIHASLRREKIMTRNQMIELLTRHELDWLVSNSEEHYVKDATEFFALGGFTTYTDDELIRAVGKLGD